MKKIAAVSLITSLIFFSCVSNKSETPVQEEPALESTEQIEETVEYIPNGEPVIEEPVENELLPEAEKISEGDLAEDELLLSEDSINETAEIPAEVTEPEETGETFIAEETASEVYKTEITEPETKTQAAPVIKKEEPKQQPQISKPLPKEVEKQSDKGSDSSSSFDLQSEASQAAEEINATETPAEPVPVPSRSSEIKNNQFIDINYPGTGWVYLGEVERQNLLIFYGRKINDGNTTFTLKSRKSGTAILHFYKNDVLSGKYIDDYIEVSIDPESATDNNHIIVPEYADVVPPKPKKPETAVAENEIEKNDIAESVPAKKNFISEPEKKKSNEPQLNIQTNIQNTDANKSEENNAVITTPLSEQSSEKASLENQKPIQVTGDLLQAAQKAYDEKRYSEALSLIRAFLADTSDRIDQGLFLEGQILEADSEVQNIKDSISDYDTLVKNWPQSRLWKKANERSIYLKRFYIDIR